MYVAAILFSRSTLHRDALPCVPNIAEMLLRLYYLYSKSPKKSRELADIVGDLKDVFEFPKGSNIPKRCQGSRWINHKRMALQRVVDRYGAYITHIAALIEDTSLKSDDRARLKGYVKKWRQARMLIGVAMYIDALKAPSRLSLSLQENNLDVVSGIEYLLKSIKSLKAIAEKDPQSWPTVQLVTSRMKDEDGKKVYQGAVLANYNSTTLQNCGNSALADFERLAERMQARLEWSNLVLLRATVAFLDTMSWKRGEEDDDLQVVQAAVECLVSHFRQPLEAKAVDLAKLHDEVENVVTYARKYLSCETERYQQIWYKLHTSPVPKTQWPNVLQLCQLVYSLPFSNSHVEQLFSTLKMIKAERRTRLQTETLSDLLEITVEGPPLENFSPDEAIKLWWDDCKTTRRTSQQPRKPYSLSTSSTSQSSDTVTNSINLDEWDHLFETEDEISGGD